VIGDEIQQSPSLIHDLSWLIVAKFLDDRPLLLVHLLQRGEPGNADVSGGRGGRAGPTVAAASPAALSSR